MAEPSPEDVLLGLQFALSIPEPPELSAQFQVTVTLLLFQPAPLAAGDWVGLALGGMESIGVQEVAPAEDVEPAAQSVCDVAPAAGT